IFHRPEQSIAISGCNGTLLRTLPSPSTAMTERLQLRLPTSTWQSNAMILVPRGSPSITFQTFEKFWNGVPSSVSDLGSAAKIMHSRTSRYGSNRICTVTLGGMECVKHE